MTGSPFRWTSVLRLFAVATVALLTATAAYPQAAPPPMIIPSTLTMPHSSSATLTFDLGTTTRSGVTFNMSSSDTSIVTTPPTITVPAGQQTTTFTINSLPKGGMVTITATFTNGNGATTTVTAQVTVSPPTSKVLVSSMPAAIVQLPTEGGSTSFVLTNVGDEPTTVTLSKTHDFFTATPNVVDIDAGASRIVEIRSIRLDGGFYQGFVLMSGTGVPPGLRVPIRVLSRGYATDGKPAARPATTRVDLSGTGNPSGSLTFRNEGTGTVNGLLVGDVPWIIPEEGEIVIPPGGSRTVNFTIDRSLRPDANFPQGSASCNLILTYLPDNPNAKSRSANAGPPPPPSMALAGVVDTSKPPTGSSALAPLGPGEVALFVAGVGNVMGSGGRLFISDFGIVNKTALSTAGDINLLYKPSNAVVATAANVASLPSAASIIYGDLVKSVFGSSNQVGTLQIRSGSVNSLSANANVFNANDPKGTFGTAIPVFRSDRAALAGENLVLTGLRSDATSHTNLYIQEASGAPANARIEFLDQLGNIVSAIDNQAVGAFSLVQLNNIVPQGAVTARVINNTNARLVAYATPVDDLSGDTWAVADWNRQFPGQPNETLVIPVAGAVRGANSTYFRTDLSVINNGNATATTTLRYYPRGGSPIDKQLTVSPKRTMTLNDVITTFFGFTTDSVGFLLLLPNGSNSISMTSRTYTTVIGDNATFGTAVPSVPASSALKFGEFRLIAGLEDASAPRTIGAVPATFRTNFGLVETSGSAATVRVSVSFADGRALSGGGVKATKDFPMAPFEFKLVSGLVRSVLGDLRDSLYGDLHQIEARFEIIAGDGRVIPFVTSTDNGTGDTVFRVE